VPSRRSRHPHSGKALRKNKNFGEINIRTKMRTLFRIKFRTFFVQMPTQCAKQSGTEWRSPVRKSKGQSSTNELGANVQATGAVDDTDDVSERICLTLANAISQGAIKPGEKVHEDTLAQHFKVSRTVVRGALGILQRDKLLERRRNRGTFVAAPSVDEAKQLFEARRLIETMVVETLAHKIDGRGLEKLEQLITDEQRIHAGHDQPVKTALSGQFHIVLASCCGNEVLTEALSKIIARISLVTALYQPTARDTCGTDHHRDIVAAIGEGNIEKAKSLMDHHLADMEASVRLDAPPAEKSSFADVLKKFNVA
jgi:DNA-binding GntR family transcriptional regulator